MGSAFITALQLSILTVKSAKGYTCICGLTLGISVDEIDPGQAGPVLEDAHRRHHTRHFGNDATLYMVGDPIALAQCSCEYKKEHPDAL